MITNIINTNADIHLTNSEYGTGISRIINGISADYDGDIFLYNYKVLYGKSKNPVSKGKKYFKRFKKWN
jgi:hypothetical protein